MNTVAILFSLLVVSAVSASPTERYVVAMERGVAAHRATAILRDIDVAPAKARAVVEFRRLDAFAADLTAGEARRLRASKDVRYVERVSERRILSVPDRLSTNVWRNLEGQTIPAGIDRVHARDVWSVTRGAQINVAVIDTGVDYLHPDLAGIYAGGYNAIAQSADPMDDHDHGTHVAGIIAAADNNLGVVGIAPNVRLWAVKAMRGTGAGQTDDIVAAIDWVIGKKRELGGKWIMNLSFGSQERNAAEEDAVANAISEGILVIAGSGNDSTESAPMPVAYPAAYPGVLAIGAVDESLRHAPFSNGGTQLAAVAPGVDVLSTIRRSRGILATVIDGSNASDATPLDAAGKGTVTAAAIYCGIGRQSDFPPSVAGNIAIIRRGGDIPFGEKTRRAKAAGARAVVFVDYAESTDHRFSLLDDGGGPFDWPVAVTLANTDGERLIVNAGATITVANLVDDYGVKTGTSMAAPHATGAAALAWSIAPDATPADVMWALRAAATDIGAPGPDLTFGFGVIHALDAAKLLNPGAFGLPEPPPTGRRVLRRGRR